MRVGSGASLPGATRQRNGGTRTVFTIKRAVARTVSVPAPAPATSRRLRPRPAAPRRPFRLTLLHNNDGKSQVRGQRLDQRNLGGAVTAARYPVGGSDRITIAP